MADPKGKWDLEIHMPEDRMGHIARAINALHRDPANKDKNLPVSYIVATNPGASREGVVTDVQKIAEVRGDEGNVVLVRVAIEQRRPGRGRDSPRRDGQRESRLRLGVGRLRLVPRRYFVRPVADLVPSVVSVPRVVADRGWRRRTERSHQAHIVRSRGVRRLCETSFKTSGRLPPRLAF